VWSALGVIHFRRADKFVTTDLIRLAARERIGSRFVEVPSKPRNGRFAPELFGT
jgi:hypothetical protein